MPLVDQLVELPWTQGLDSKTDPRLVARPTTLQNLVFRGRALAPGYGSTMMGGTDDAGAAVANISGMATIGAALLRAGGLTNGTHTVHGYSSAKTHWTQAQLIPPVGVIARQSLVRGGGDIASFDAARANNVTVVAWTDGSNQTVRACAIDESTGSFWIRDTQLSSVAASTHPRVVVVGSWIHVYWLDNAGANKNLVGSRLNTAAPTSFSLIGNIRTDAENWFDAYSAGSAAVIAYRVTGGAAYTLIQVNDAGAVAGSPAPTTQAATLASTSCITVVRDDNANVFILTTDGVNTVQLRVHGPTFALSTTLTVDNTVRFVRATMAARTTDVVIFYETVAPNATVKQAVATTSAITEAAATIVQGASLATGAVLPSTPGAPVMVGIAYDHYGLTDLEPTGFIIAKGGAVVARVLPGACSSRSTRTPTPFASVSGLSFAFGETDGLIYDPSTGLPVARTASGVCRLTFTPLEMRQLPRVTFGNSLFIGGAKPMVFDGSALVEFGFQVFPEGLEVTANGAGNLSAGVYQWCGIYEWVDGQGQLWRSAPSPPVTATLGANTQQTITIPNLCITDKTVTSNKVVLHLYRTEHDKTVFYRATSISAPTINDPPARTVGINDNLADADLIKNEVLYTVGGALEAIPPPACTLACVHGKRLVIAGLENPFEIRYSTEFNGTDAPRFHESLSLFVQPKYGRITGIASMDGRLVILCEKGPWAVSGNGPNDAGLQNTFQEPEDMLGGMGCDDWRSLVEVPGAGIAFHSPAGMRLLRRDLVVDPQWGQDADGFTGLAFAAPPVLMQAQSQIRWLTQRNGTTNTVLVYDYVADAWSAVDHNGGSFSAVDHILWGSTYVKAVGPLTAQEVATTYIDDVNGARSFTAETAWIKTAGIQGFQRARRMYLLGKLLSNIQLTVDVGYDYRTTYDALDRFTVDTTDGAGGNGTTYVVGEPFQLRRHLRVQKCEAIRFRVSWTWTAVMGEPFVGGGLELDALSLQVAVRKGGYRGLSSSKSF